MVPLLILSTWLSGALPSPEPDVPRAETHDSGADGYGEGRGRSTTAPTDATTLESAPFVAPPVFPTASDSDIPLRQQAPSQPTSTDVPSEPVIAPKRSFWIPALEVLALQGGIHAFDRFVLKHDYAMVEARDIYLNFTEGWRLDADNIQVNYIGHPYHGALTFIAPRSMGLTFWESVPYSILGSAAWELLAETQEPSISDIASSGVGGALWGEALHRISNLFVNGEPNPGFARSLGAFVFDPFDQINRWAFGVEGDSKSLTTRMPWRGHFSVGALRVSGERQADRSQVTGSFDLTYGFPSWEPGCLDPIEHFDAEGRAGYGNGPATIDLYVRGMLAGCRFGSPYRRTALGAFINTDFTTGPGFRLADVGVGPGATSEIRFGDKTALRSTLVPINFFIGGTGPMNETDLNNPSGGRDLIPAYPVGVGYHAMLDMELSHPDIGSARLTGRVWFPLGITPSPESQTVEAYALSLFGPRAWPVVPGARFTWHALHSQDAFPGERGWMAQGMVSLPLGND